MTELIRKIKRRAFLAGSAALAPATLAAITVTRTNALQAADVPPVNDPIPGWYRDWLFERDAYNHGNDDSAYERMVLLENRISGAWPRSTEGVVAKLQWVLAYSDGEHFFTGHDEAIQTAVAGLKSGATAVA